MICPICNSQIPEDSGFCIECGADLQSVSVATTKLPTRPEEIICRECGSSNPRQAAFCMQCGRPFSVQTMRTATTTSSYLDNRPFAEPPRPTPFEPPPFQAPVPLSPPAPEQPPESSWQGKWKPHKKHKPKEPGWVGIIFLVGLAILIFNGWIWPGIFLVIGVTGFTGSLASRQGAKSLLPLIFMVGMFVVAFNSWWWPGMLVLMIIMAIASKILD